MVAASGSQAVANGRTYTSYDSGMCQKYVRGPCWSVGSLYGSAIEAWNGAKYKHPGDRNPPLGAPMYYRGGSYGHAVINTGQGRIRSTDCASTGKVSDADTDWPEHAWGYDYLGWTGDINGVTLPLGDTDDDGGDDVPHYDHAKRSTTLQLTPGTWTDVKWPDVLAGDAFKEGNPGASISGRLYTAVLAFQATVKQGTSIWARTYETKQESDGDWVRAETNPAHEQSGTTGNTNGRVSFAGSVATGRGIRWEMSADAPATVVSADVVLLSWD